MEKTLKLREKINIDSSMLKEMGIEGLFVLTDNELKSLTEAIYSQVTKACELTENELTILGVENSRIMFELVPQQDNEEKRAVKFFAEFVPDVENKVYSGFKLGFGFENLVQVTFEGLASDNNNNCWNLSINVKSSTLDEEDFEDLFQSMKESYLNQREELQQYYGQRIKEAIPFFTLVNE